MRGRSELSRMSLTLMRATVSDPLHNRHDGQFAHARHAQIARRVILSQPARLAPSGKSDALIRPSRARQRGALRGRHEVLARDAMAALHQLTSDARRTAKSCGPDLPTLRSSLVWRARGDGGQKARRTEETTYKP